VIRVVRQVVIMLILSCLLTAVPSGHGAIAAPSPKDKCPVCGMFVAKFPDWATGITFRDGTSLYFDGAKDLFTFLQNVKKYTPARNAGDIGAIQVKDYYSLKSIDGRAALYVIGSDVFGPMGKELVPFEKPADAQAFLRDHNGKKVLRFGDITRTILKSME
jgi:copper chaperone NosL